ncbi:hypothetical protein N7462_009300 [Penicillium macrosclerotiorum]|uniref:uncharacterized protein n=1 Tax=Penicillium macrosclerotiorum TaxID=303699 RepID=UPI002548CBBF|nr:uncharacterized protein N7462_009300 [Penicillium macrosclerotiorum]KAJ5673861.1 hypothetical protein N7462_009300 [Penicillium macrosclerotiorum]
MQSYRPSERSSYNTEDIRHIRHIRQEIHDDYERLIKMYRRLAETRSTMSEHEIREQERKINYLKSTIENRQNDIGWRPPSMGANRMGRQSEAAGDLEEQLERLKLGMEQLMENQQWSKAQKAKLGERINQRILARSQYGQKDRGVIPGAVTASRTTSAATANDELRASFESPAAFRIVDKFALCISDEE